MAWNLGTSPHLHKLQTQIEMNLMFILNKTMRTNSANFSKLIWKEQQCLQWYFQAAMDPYQFLTIMFKIYNPKLLVILKQKKEINKSKVYSLWYFSHIKM